MTGRSEAARPARARQPAAIPNRGLRFSSRGGTLSRRGNRRCDPASSRQPHAASRFAHATLQGVHIPDGYLSPSTCAALYAGAAPFWWVALRRLQRTLHTRLVPRISLFAAFSFVVMMFNVPLPGGTTGHATGVALAAVVLGPSAAILAVSAALVIQAFFFGDGGITALGANCFNIAIVGSLVAFVVYRAVGRARADRRAAPRGRRGAGRLCRDQRRRAGHGDRVRHPAAAVPRRVGRAALLPVSARHRGARHDDRAPHDRRDRGTRADGRRRRVHPANRPVAARRRRRPPRPGGG